MKRYLFFIAPLLILAVLTSCKFDDEEVAYPSSKMLFTYQTFNRQVVVGEGLDLQIGVVFSGYLENKSERIARCQFDPTVIPTSIPAKTQLPASLYANPVGSTFDIVVPKGSLKGYYTMHIDSLAFVSDSRALTGEYVVPVRIVEAIGADQINPDKATTVISLSYLGKQYGKYTYNGTRTSASGSETYKSDPLNANSVRQMITRGANQFLVYADQVGTNDKNKGKVAFLVTVPVHGGGAVTITAAPVADSPLTVTPDGASSYDEASKTFTLRYKYTDGGVEYKAVDYMYFRDRIRDDQGDGRVLYEWRGF